LKDLSCKSLQKRKVEDFFWLNLADRFLFNSWKLRIKMGLVKSIFLPYDDIASHFDPSFLENKRDVRPFYFGGMDKHKSLRKGTEI
jgi:hypothetical protein